MAENNNSTSGDVPPPPEFPDYPDYTVLEPITFRAVPSPNKAGAPYYTPPTPPERVSIFHDNVHCALYLVQSSRPKFHEPGAAGFYDDLGYSQPEEDLLEQFKVRTLPEIRNFQTAQNISNGEFGFALQKLGALLFLLDISITDKSVITEIAKGFVKAKNDVEEAISGE